MGVISNGTTLLDAGAIDSGVPTGAMTLIKTLTASGSSTLSFVHGASSVVLDGTYKQYLFKFINIHPASASKFEFNFTIDSGNNYNVTKTSTTFGVFHTEADNSASLAYKTAHDLAQGTGNQILSVHGDVGTANDMSFCGTLRLFDPANTTFVKHFMATSNFVDNGPTSMNPFVAGYGNTTSAINGVRFAMGSGAIASGQIKLYGIK
jgi:hypothetical protein|tara:strand:+ start:275 stop:895 length:621 start_codon:yes stop_codon:yes gene_type:complete